MNAKQRYRMMLGRKRELEAFVSRARYVESMMATSPSLSFFKEIGNLARPVMLLRHLALVFGKRTFDPHKAPEEICGFVFTKGIADSSAELQEAHLYILTDSWPTLVFERFVAEAPPGSGMYEITAHGWAMVESNEEIVMPL